MDSQQGVGLQLGDNGLSLSKISLLQKLTMSFGYAISR
jgi:hypothetical protein